MREDGCGGVVRSHEEAAFAFAGHASAACHPSRERTRQTLASSDSRSLSFLDSSTVYFGEVQRFRD